MRKRYFFPLILALVIVACTFVIKSNVVPTITYFPIDSNYSFIYAKSNLDITTDQKSDYYNISWSSSSKSNDFLYLRQDLSLLYINGKFKGVQSKWIENTDTIILEETFRDQTNGFLQVISYHHGEIHSTNEQINSVQTMSSTNLYVTEGPNGFMTVKPPTKDADDTWIEQLDLTTKQHLLTYWNQLITHFDLDIDNYTTVPLVHLNKFNDENLPSLSKQQTDQIIGQLWEGLYKNYVVPISNAKRDSPAHGMPLILFDKEQTHLIVLYEWNEKKKKLIQQYPTFTE